MRRFCLVALIISVTGIMVAVPGRVHAEHNSNTDPALLSVSAGAYDFNRQRDEGSEFRIEYRSNKKVYSVFKPFVAVAYTSTSQGFIGAGFLVDYDLSPDMVLTASLAPNYYWGGDSDLDLGHEVEFRSQLEVAYRFHDRSRLGVAISHYSNAGLGSSNPGTETASVYYSFPLE